MKPSKVALLLSVAVTGMLSLSQARADLESQYFWNYGQSYAAFTLGSGLGSSSMTNTVVTGDIGIGPGGQNLVVDSSDQFAGNIYLAPGSTVSGSPTFNGSNAGPPNQPSGPYGVMAGSTSRMTSQANQLLLASGSFASMATATNFTSSSNRLFTPGAKNLNISGGTLTLSETASNSVLNLSTFTMGNSTLDLVGDGANSTFVFNISGSFRLSQAHINLSGGLTAGNVVFNLTGASPTSDGEGTTNYYTLLNSTISGSIIAPNRTVALTNSTLTGTAVGERIVSSGSLITQSPASP